MKKSTRIEDRREEINCIYELLQATLEEEGYKLPKFTHADRGDKSFPIKLKNGVTQHDEVTIKIEFDVYD
jgi:hypothetical protein